MSKNKKRWLWFATLGLILIGMGLCLVIDAAFFRSGGAPLAQWITYGTGALIVFNSGLSIFGQAIIERIRYLKETGDF